MNRQAKRRFTKRLGVSDKELDNLAEHFRKENEAKNRELIIQFLSLTIEALRIEFGFGQKRIDRYTKRVDELLDDINLEFVTFEDLIKEISISPADMVRLSHYQKEEIKKKTEELRKQA